MLWVGEATHIAFEFGRIRLFLKFTDWKYQYAQNSTENNTVLFYSPQIRCEGDQVMILSSFSM